MNIWSYVDGFNLYNGAFRGSPYKWLDVLALSAALRPTDQVSHAKYFTARVNARPNDLQQPMRQMRYWRALRAVGSVEIIEGRFLTKPTYLPTVTSVDQIARMHASGGNAARMAPTMAHVYRSEEKGTDVNLAIHLVHDAHLSRFDSAIVISNDSDLAGAIRIVRSEIGKPIYVFCPRSPHPSFQLRQAATRFRSIETRHLASSQFPSTMTDANGAFVKPSSW